MQVSPTAPGAKPSAPPVAAAPQPAHPVKYSVSLHGPKSCRTNPTAKITWASTWCQVYRGGAGTPPAPAPAATATAPAPAAPAPIRPSPKPRNLIPLPHASARSQQPAESRLWHGVSTISTHTPPAATAAPATCFGCRPQEETHSRILSQTPMDPDYVRISQARPPAAWTWCRSMGGRSQGPSRFPGRSPPRPVHGGTGATKVEDPTLSPRHPDRGPGPADH